MRNRQGWPVIPLWLGGRDEGRSGTGNHQDDLPAGGWDSAVMDPRICPRPCGRSVPAPFIEKTVLPPLNFFCAFVKTLGAFLCGAVSGPCSIGLPVYPPTSTTLSPSPATQEALISAKIMPPTSLCFFRIILAKLGPCLFVCHLKSSCLYLFKVLLGFTLH